MGLATLHLRGLAMQDVSVENMLLYELEDGQWKVKVCDPGQAVTFAVDPVTGIESEVDFGGFVGKEFRPPELYTRRPYLASKVDAWCLGWSTFYLLCAQPMFESADPSVDDPDWELFEDRAFPKLFHEKGWRAGLSTEAKDFILKLMDMNPHQRMSARDALRHPWLATFAAESNTTSAAARVAEHRDSFGAPARERFGSSGSEAVASASAWSGGGGISTQSRATTAESLDSLGSSSFGGPKTSSVPRKLVAAGVGGEKRSEKTSAAAGPWPRRNSPPPQRRWR